MEHHLGAEFHEVEGVEGVADNWPDDRDAFITVQDAHDAGPAEATTSLAAHVVPGNPADEPTRQFLGGEAEWTPLWQSGGREVGLIVREGGREAGLVPLLAILTAGTAFPLVFHGNVVVCVRDGEGAFVGLTKVEGTRFLRSLLDAKGMFRSKTGGFPLLSLDNVAFARFALMCALGDGGYTYDSNNPEVHRA